MNKALLLSLVFCFSSSGAITTAPSYGATPRRHCEKPNYNCPCETSPMTQPGVDDGSPTLGSEAETGDDYRSDGNYRDQQPRRPQQTAQDFFATALKRGSYLTSSISPTGAGLGTATAMDTSTILASNVLQPFVSPGLLTSANVETPYALDRIGFAYSYYDSFQVLNTQVVFDNGPPESANVTTTRETGFDLNRFDILLEKTILSGVASIYVRGPFLDATNNVFGIPMDGPGNVGAGIKFQLLHNESTGDILTAGLTVSAPTAREGIFVESEINSGPPNTLRVVEVNPTFIQPWLGVQLNGDRIFINGYLGILVPTDDRVVTTFNSSLAFGYVAYENRCKTISSIAPVVSVQVLNPIHDSSALLDFSDQVFITPGLQMGLGDRTYVNCGVTTPVAGPKAFDVGATAGINFLF